MISFNTPILASLMNLKIPRNFLLGHVMMLGWCPGSVWTYIRAASHSSARSQAHTTWQLLGMAMTTWALELLTVLGCNGTPVRKSAWPYRGHDPVAEPLRWKLLCPSSNLQGVSGRCRPKVSGNTEKNMAFETGKMLKNSYKRKQSHHTSQKVDLSTYTFSGVAIGQPISDLLSHCGHVVSLSYIIHMSFRNSYICSAQEDFNVETTHLQSV